MANNIEPFFKQKNWMKYFEKNLEGRELLEALYREWTSSRDKDLFLFLYTQTWLSLEDVYMRDTERFYQEGVYEKDLFLELLDYGEKHFNKDIKFRLLTGHILSTISYYFWMEEDAELLEQKGEKLLSDLFSEYPEDFMVQYFYMPYRLSNKQYIRWRRKKEVREKVCDLFPSEAEVDTYFSEMGMFVFTELQRE